MASFEPAFEKMIQNEGGYQLTRIEGDRGGLTYAGISQHFHPNWQGWSLLESNPQSPEITPLVRAFYQSEFWQKVCGDDIQAQDIAENIFDFAVNAGVATSAKLAQVTVESTPDGIIGPKTLGKLNTIEPHLFVSQFAVAKVARYAAICNSNPSQKKFLLGWINRTLEGLK